LLRKIAHLKQKSVRDLAWAVGNAMLLEALRIIALDVETANACLVSHIRDMAKQALLLTAYLGTKNVENLNADSARCRPPFRNDLNGESMRRTRKPGRKA
jgi:hypothetical protein